MATTRTIGALRTLATWVFVTLAASGVLAASFVPADIAIEKASARAQTEPRGAKANRLACANASEAQRPTRKPCKAEASAPVQATHSGSGVTGARAPSARTGE